IDEVDRERRYAAEVVGAGAQQAVEQPIAGQVREVRRRLHRDRRPRPGTRASATQPTTSSSSGVARSLILVSDFGWKGCRIASWMWPYSSASARIATSVSAASYS